MIEPNLFIVGILTSTGVVLLTIRLGWLRYVAVRVAVAVWITVIVLIACLPLCAKLPGGFVFAFFSGLAAALPATWLYHRMAEELHGYPAETQSAPQGQPQRNWTAAQRVQAGMKSYATYKVVAK